MNRGAMKPALLFLSLVLLCSASNEINQRAILHMEVQTYPQLARGAQIQGEINLDVTVANDGRVVSIQPAAGHPLLADPSSENVKTWIFTKADKETKERITFVYKLGERQSFRPKSFTTIESPNRIVVISEREEPQN